MTTRLEQELQEIGSVGSLESRTSEGRAFVESEVSDGRTTDLFRFEVQDRLAALSRDLPEGVFLSLTSSSLEAFRDERDFMVLQIAGPLAPADLRELAERQVAPQFLKLPGVAGYVIGGGEELELLASLDRGPLDVHRESIVGLRQELASALRDQGYGTLATAEQRILLHRRSLRDPASLFELPLVGLAEARRATLRVGDLCRIEIGTAPVRSKSRINGNPAVTLTLDRTPGSHLMRVAKEVHTAVDAARTALPPGAVIQIADDRSQDIRKQLRDLAIRGGLGLVLVILTLAAMLRDRRAVGIALLLVIVSAAAALTLFKPLGITLNILTIAGMVLLSGLLMDNAVVVVERLQVELTGRGGRAVDYISAARRAVQAVWLPLLGGTLTTCIAFLPMVYLSGDLKPLFVPFATLCTLTLGVSLVASVVLIFNLGHGLQSRTARKAMPKRVRCGYLLPYRLQARYPRLSLLLLALLIGLPTPLLPDLIEEPSEGWLSEDGRLFAERYNATVGSDRFRMVRVWLDPLLGGVTRPFLKNVELGKRWDFDERPQVRVHLQLPPGTGVERADERIRPFEEEAHSSPAVERTLVNVQNRVATLLVLFREEAIEGDEPFLLRERLIAHALQIAGMEVTVSGLLPTSFHSGMGEVSGLTIHAFGSGYESLEAAARDFARRLERHPRVAEVDVQGAERGQPPTREVLRFHWSSDAAAQTGLSARGLAETLQARLWREAPDFYTDFAGRARMPVRFVMSEAENLNLETLLGTSVAVGPGGPVRLGDHAELSIEKDPPVIERIDQQYRRTLRVFFRGPYDMARKMIDREIAAAKLPPGYRMERPKLEFFTEEVWKELGWLVLGTVALVFLSIAMVLESWKLAAVSMLAVPLSWIGLALGFVVTRQNFAEGAFIGSLLIVGISVNNSILLVNGFQRLKQVCPGQLPRRLALLALRQRLRPMWITTLTSVASMLPVLVIPEAGSFWVGLAVAVVGGLLSSTFLAPAAVMAVLSLSFREEQESRAEAPEPRLSEA